MYELKCSILLFLLLQLVSLTLCSDGDRSPFYQKCLQKCKNTNCTSDGVFTHEAAQLQDIWDWLLCWGCEDECRYHCMWRTVQGYKERNYEIPKFHGKWPFHRILGVQEPASAFASALNLLSHILMYRKLIKQFPLKDTPMIMLWHFFAWVCIHAWVWSTVFHTRDKFFTEFMDYACALSMVMSFLVAAIVRIFYKRARAVWVTLVALLMLYFAMHARYLYTGRIDYDYNMHVNVFFGVVGFGLWLVWAARQYAAGRRYAWHLMFFSAMSGGSLSLELWDNPPRHGWDTHALWHLSTWLLPNLFYRFVIADLNYLRQSSVKSDVKLP